MHYPKPDDIVIHQHAPDSFKDPFSVMRTVQVDKGQKVISSGPYATVRHPMYLGFILWIFGWAIFHGAVISLVAGLVGIGNILYWRHLEEEDLEATYGDEFRNYRSQTWF